MSGFTDFLEDVFAGFGQISCRKMFGGYGVYHQGTMFGLVADDILFLKADESIADYFLKRDLPQFEYPKGDKLVKMSYYQAPEEIYDDAVEAENWARRSYECAVRAKEAKAK